MRSLGGRRWLACGASTALAVGLVAVGPGWACTPTASIAVEPKVGPPSSLVMVSGQGFVADRPVDIHWNSMTGPVLASPMGPSFSTKIVVPDVAAGSYYVIATARGSDGSLAGRSSAAFEVTSPPPTTTTTTTTTTTNPAPAGPTGATGQTDATAPPTTAQPVQAYVPQAAATTTATSTPQPPGTAGAVPAGGRAPSGATTTLASGGTARPPAASAPASGSTAPAVTSSPDQGTPPSAPGAGSSSPGGDGRDGSDGGDAGDATLAAAASARQPGSDGDALLPTGLAVLGLLVSAGGLVVVRAKGATPRRPVDGVPG
ncbi:MAG: hypothetical protein ACT4PX_06825 [Actinomycetota bacterium]